jgi:hypothetical protein
MDKTYHRIWPPNEDKTLFFPVSLLFFGNQTSSRRGTNLFASEKLLECIFAGSSILILPAFVPFVSKTGSVIIQILLTGYCIKVACLTLVQQ